MSTNGLPPDNALETRIAALLRGQPPRRAPATLEARVLAAIEQRRTAPWWQRSFGEWPLAARLAFFTTSLAVAVLALLWTPRLTDVLQPFTRWLPLVAQLARTAYDTAAVVLHAIPQLWLASAAVFAALLYLATFALGATAYRTLYSRT
jgi:hypothetical protein